MKILLEKIKKLEHLEKIADEAETRYTEEPENTELESAFDKAYKAEFDKYIECANYIVNCTGGKVSFNRAKYLINVKREELKRLVE